MELIDLDRIDAAIHVAVVRLGDRAAERLVDTAHLRAQHVLEAQQNGELHTSAAQLVDDVDDVDRGAGFVECAHGHVAFRVGEEERIAPARDPIELGGVLHRPFRGRRFLVGLGGHENLSPKAWGYSPSTWAKISGATIVASDSMMNLGVEADSLPHVIFSFGTAPE